MRRKGLELEAEVLSRAVQLYLNDQLVVVNENVVFRPGLSTLLDGARPASAS